MSRVKNQKENWEWYKEILGTKARSHEVADMIRIQVNRLIELLYLPKNGFWMPDKKRIEQVGIDMDEPINWADLKCNGVTTTENGIHQVLIDEAAPNSCPTFCEYIRNNMEILGWEVEVITEW